MIDFTLENLTFENCSRAYEIDRSDIPDDFVDDVPTPIGTILLGEGLFCENDPQKVKDKPFYRLVFFVLDKNFRGKGLGKQILEKTIETVYKDFGRHPVVLGVHKDNEKAFQFYLKNGFVKTSYMDGDDYVMIKNP